MTALERRTDIVFFSPLSVDRVGPRVPVSGLQSRRLAVSTKLA